MVWGCYPSRFEGASQKQPEDKGWSSTSTFVHALCTHETVLHQPWLTAPTKGYMSHDLGMLAVNQSTY